MKLVVYRAISRYRDTGREPDQLYNSYLITYYLIIYYLITHYPITHYLITYYFITDHLLTDHIIAYFSITYQISVPLFYKHSSLLLPLLPSSLSNPTSVHVTSSSHNPRPSSPLSSRAGARESAAVLVERVGGGRRCQSRADVGEGSESHAQGRQGGETAAAGVCHSRDVAASVCAVQVGFVSALLF